LKLGHSNGRAWLKALWIIFRIGSRPSSIGWTDRSNWKEKGIHATRIESDDEAHRFAITYHKKVRSRETIKSELGEIPGIGPIRQKELLKCFGTVEKIKQTAEEELAKAPQTNGNL
jgi:ERCC4-type nuclease